MDCTVDTGGRTRPERLKRNHRQGFPEDQCHPSSEITRFMDSAPSRTQNLGRRINSSGTNQLVTSSPIRVQRCLNRVLARHRGHPASRRPAQLLLSQAGLITASRLRSARFTGARVPRCLNPRVSCSKHARRMGFRTIRDAPCHYCTRHPNPSAAFTTISTSVTFTVPSWFKSLTAAEAPRA